MKNILLFLFISFFISCNAQDNSFEGDGKVDFETIEGAISFSVSFCFHEGNLESALL